MRKYNFIRPLMLIVIALLVKSLITNLCMVFGMAQAQAENIGFISMLIAAIIVYSRIARKRRK
ncbi:putative membrane-anchored protein [Paenibacillus endophyticus]|uniref:Putative membrane-anchored protein n=1 Tax=Paenibacillus endophyticus TaxID=1294268 RepID=A0A7W5CG23_9BACL|nr:hypothetical protein [Paenibacillus endophyticus]MBB3156199.1 putative membrane-anchored protein [Paenibacillus endophyticus]